MKIKSTVALAATAATLLLSACGGGGDAGTTTTTPTGGGSSPTATAVSYGSITQFGSIWVNGVEFSTSGSSFRIDDNPGTQSDLRIGMVVRVDGSFSAKTASTVTVDDALKGRVEQVLDANRIVVMGQTVQIDDQTRFEGNVVPVVGDYVEVHGQAVADGTVAAGFIQKKSTLPTPPYAVKGFVMNHNAAAQSFAIGNLGVTYAGALVSEMPVGSWNGQLVEVKGSTCAGNPVCGTLTASKVEPGGLQVDAMAESEVEGFVTSTTANGFVVGSQAVVTTSSTVFSGGVLADITVGTKVEVEGAISGGVLTAVKVSRRDNVRFEADVASVNVAGGSLTMAGLPGVTVKANSLTRFKGGATALANLAAPNHLRVRGRMGAGNSVIATEIELRSATPDARVILQAPVSAVAGTASVTLLGIVVGTASVADSEFKNTSDVSIGRAGFYAAVKPGTLVKARGDLGGGSVVWNQMEIED